MASTEQLKGGLDTDGSVCGKTWCWGDALKRRPYTLRSDRGVVFQFCELHAAVSGLGALDRRRKSMRLRRQRPSLEACRVAIVEHDRWGRCCLRMLPWVPG